MIKLNQRDGEPDARKALQMAESRATSAFAFAFALCPDSHVDLSEVYDHHLEASRCAPVEATGYQAPQLDAWRRAEMQLRLLSCPAPGPTVVGILLRAEEQWLRALHRWILGTVHGPDRARVCRALLGRQWRNRNQVLACLQSMHLPSWL